MTKFLTYATYLNFSNKKKEVTNPVDHFNIITINFLHPSHKIIIEKDYTLFKIIL